MDWDAFIAATLSVPHTVSVRAYVGAGARGDVHATAVEVPGCFVDHKRRRVRVATGDAAGAEVISSTTVYAPPGTTAAPGSLVTLPSGDVAKVLVQTVHDAAGLPLPEHVELALE